MSNNVLADESRNHIVMTFTKGKKKKGISSEVYAFKDKSEIDSMINVFNKRIEESLPRSKWIPERDKLLFIIGINRNISLSNLYHSERHILSCGRCKNENGIFFANVRKIQK